MTQCHQCSTALPQPLPRFCPQCGAPSLPASPAYQPQGGNPGAALASNKQTFIALGLFVLGILAGGGPAVTILGLAWLAAIPLVVLDALNPSFWAQVPAVLRRPILGAAVSLLAIITVAVPGGLSFGWFFLAGGTYLWLKEALRRGEVGLGPLDFRLLWYGWRRWLLVGIALASFTFGGTWEPWTYVYGYSTTERHWDGTYRVWHPGSSYGEGSAMAIGAATVPALILTAVLLWASYTGKDGRVPSWFRFVPLAASPVLVLWAVRYMGVPQWTQGMSNVTASPAWGPYGFVLFLAPFFLTAVNLARGKNHWKA